MRNGSKSETPENADRRKVGQKTGSVQPRIEPFVPKRDHSPRELKSWAKRTGFVSNFSGETGPSLSERDPNERTELDLEKGVDKTGSSSPKIEIDPILGRARNRGSEIEPVFGFGRGLPTNGEDENWRNRIGTDADPEFRANDDEKKKKIRLNWIGNGPFTNGIGHEIPAIGENRGDPNQNQNWESNGSLIDGESFEREMGINGYPNGDEPGRPEPESESESGLKCRLRENPGYVPLICYGLQHYLSLAGSLIFIPLIIVPAMGGTDRDTATVISTMLLLSGITTILHLYFGTRLPLVQGSSFVYLAPALVIMNAREFRNLTDHKFRYIMRELQGAIIVGSIFQSILGFSGLMSLLLRLINPVVVAPTVAAVGLAFFSFGFPLAGSCVEISLPMIILVLVFTLYLHGISLFGHRVFRIYAVPLSVVIIWAYAFFLTAGGAYNYKGCSPDVPSSNILNEACRKHAYTMKHCRTDVSNALRTAAWVRIPYPLQWGIPIFHFRTSLVMIVVSLVATVDSVGTYHTASLRIGSKAPSPGIVSRGIGLEGFCSILAGLWGSGTGSTSLTENVHTIEITKVASRKAIELGAVFMILFSFIGKIGAILASIPPALAAAVLCFMWGLVVALALSTLHHTQTGSFRNMTIVGVALFLGLSIPSYVQQYQPISNLILPSYFVPYSAASNGPVHTGTKQFDFAVNALLSLNMVVTLVVALILDNTVPGSQEERGVYVWSSARDIATDPSSHSDYSLPRKVAKFFRWAKCLGG